MDIVLILETGGVKGGAEKVAFQSAEGLKKLGHRVWLITAAKEVEADFAAVLDGWLALDEQSFYLEKDKVKKLKKVLGNPYVVEPVNQFMKRFDRKETVVHAHTYRLNLSGRVMKAVQDLGFCTVQTCHEYSIACPTSLFFDYRTEQVCTKRPLSVSCIACECTGTKYRYKVPRLASAWANRTLYRVPQRVDGYIHVSSLEKERLDPWIGAFGAHLLLPNPQEISELPPANPANSDQFIYIGRLTPEKNPTVFCEACRLAGVKGVIAGDGPLRKQLEASYPEISFLGWQSSSSVVDRLRASRALVMPSAWEETFGLSVVDAMGNGIPPIISSMIGAKDWINHGETGMIVDSVTPEAFADAIRSMTPETAKRMGDQAFQRVLANPPTVEKHVDALLNFYSELLSQN